MPRPHWFAPLRRQAVTLRRRVTLVLLVTASACATAATSPALDAPGNCAWRVCVRTRDTRRGRRYYVINQGPVPATVILSFGSLQNMRSNVPLPVERIVAARSTRELALVEVVNRRAPVAARASISIDLGASDTAADEEYLYGIPFGGAVPHRLIQGFDGSETHLGGMRYALDFAMPEGTPVLASRSGTVVHVQDGFTEGGPDPDLLTRANVVVVAHSDGTMASYGHLARGIPVSVGNAVEEGDIIAYSGATGFAGQPHLHFHVGVRLLGDPGRTIPFRLKDGSGRAVNLEAGSTFEPAEARDRR